MDQPALRRISEIIARTPEWVRSEFGDKDRALRQRAEETLAAMIAAAIDGDRR